MRLIMESIERIDRKYHRTLNMAAQKDREDPVKDIPLPLPEPRPAPVSLRLFVG